MGLALVHKGKLLLVRLGMPITFKKQKPVLKKQCFGQPVKYVQLFIDREI
jgi:hypothetical protein